MEVGSVMFGKYDENGKLIPEAERIGSFGLASSCVYPKPS